MGGRADTGGSPGIGRAQWMSSVLSIRLSSRPSLDITMVRSKVLFILIITDLTLFSLYRQGLRS